MLTLTLEPCGAGGGDDGGGEMAAVARAAAIAMYMSACEGRQGYIASARNRPEKGPTRRARRPAAHRHQNPPGAPERRLSEAFGEVVTRQ